MSGTSPSGDDTPDGGDASDDDGFASVRTLFKGGSIVFVGVVLELGISFVGKLLIARELGRVNYGTVSLGIITASIASTLLLLGLNQGIGRYLPRDDDPSTQRSVIISGFHLPVLLSIVASIALILGAPAVSTRIFDEPALTPILRVFALAIPLGVVFKLTLGTIQGFQESIPKVLIQNVTLPVTRLMGIAVAILFGLGTMGVSYAYLASYLAAALGAGYYLVRRTPLFQFGLPVESRTRELLAFSLPLLVTRAMTVVLSDIDMYMLGAFVSVGSVGVYNVIYPLAQLLTVVISSFGFLFLPVISELDVEGQDDRIHRLYQVVTKWVVVVTFPVFLVLVAFPDIAIGLTFGSEYTTGAAALSVLAVGFFVHSSFGLNKSTLTSLGYTRLLMIDDAAVAGVNVVLNLLLIPRFSVLGAAYATTISYLLLNLLYSGQLYTRTGVHPFSRSLVIPTVAGSSIVLLLFSISDSVDIGSPLALVGLVAASLVVYGVVVVRFGIQPEEVRLVLSIEERFGVDLGPLKRVLKWFM